MREFFEIVMVPIITMIALTAIIVCGVVVAINRMGFPSDLAQIEQVRADSAKIAFGQGSQIYAQVVEINMKIANEQACNRLWYCDWSQTDEWNSVRLIELPTEAK